MAKDPKDKRTRKASDDEQKAFDPDDLQSAVIALPLLRNMHAKGGRRAIHRIIIDLNLHYPDGRDAAQERVKSSIAKLLDGKRGSAGQGIHDTKTALTKQYVFAELRGSAIEQLVRIERENAVPAPHRPEEKHSAIYRIWPDWEVKPLTDRSVATIKADAARVAFSASGHGIIWAVMDSGIQGDHPHFDENQNLVLPAPLRHVDFTTVGAADDDLSERLALTDEHGHGTHVAGIIAGSLDAADEGVEIRAKVRQKDERGAVDEVDREIPKISGMAPHCRLVSLKVLDDRGSGPVSNLIAACELIHEINGNGRHIKIHGVNMSVGYDFEPKWFACGQSPLCVEVDRLVRSGVVVVVAAGNTGYGWQETAFRGAVAAGMDLTINDPGNADLAVTVGATHRDSPHVYGVSYFSSKGPTGDGRMKPDLVAPGERIISCASSGKPPVRLPGEAPHESVGAAAAPTNLRTGLYREDSGTSMAAPHVSGAIAAFLSVRREFIQRPERVKEIFMSTATDLGRAPSFQGRGLLDLMRAIQSI
jgi:serine protease AprX